ncbi:MAG: pimeloyl-ACP methyl ester esterase BioH [Gammaproteobacteria bacterium]|nr:pimeloyl-ACP methyl ester esterase BioH [Gammaproteobacteria bacterium]
MLIHTETCGSGPVCVLLHGWGMHGGVWRETARELAAHHQVISVDLPGHGHSAPLPDQDSLAALTAAIAGVVPPQSHIVGWSLGGMVAMRLAIDHPDRVAQLMLVASSPQFVTGPDWNHALTPEVLEDFARRLRADASATVRQFLALQVKGSEQEHRTLTRLRALMSEAPPPHPAALEGGLSILRSVSLLPLLGRITRSVTLIHGQRDTLIPWAAAEALRERLPRARLHLMPRAAHAPFLSHPGDFLALAQEALNGPR